MRTYRIIATTVVAVALLGLSGCVATWETSTATPIARNASSEAQQVLAPLGVLRVGVYLGSPTSLVKSAQTGASAGVAFELGHALGQQLGVPVEVVEFTRVAEVIDALKFGKIDITFTNATAARAKDVDFTQPLMKLELGLLVPAKSRIQSFADVDQAGVRLGVSQGSSSQGVLSQRLKQATVVPVASLDVAAQSLKRDQLNAFATNKGILFELAEKVPGAQVLKDQWGVENLAIAIPLGRQSGMAYLQNFAQMQVKQGEIKRMADRAGLRGLAESN